MKPFLEQFQNDTSLVPFLAQKISKILKTMMEKLIKKHLLSNDISMTSILKIDVGDSKNHVSIEKVVAGFAALNELEKENISKENTEEFKRECVKCYKTLILKIIERSPLKYETVRQLCCLNPQYIVRRSNSSVAKFGGFMSTMISHKFLQPADCDRLVDQYKDLCIKMKMEDDHYKNYNLISGERIDMLFFKLIAADPHFKLL